MFTAKPKTNDLKNRQAPDELELGKDGPSNLEAVKSMIDELSPEERQEVCDYINTKDKENMIDGAKDKTFTTEGMDS